jgi:hypothetical protein
MSYLFLLLICNAYFILEVRIKLNWDVARCEVFTAVATTTTMILFRVLEPWRPVGRYQRFGETCCLHFRGWKWGHYVSPKRWHLPTGVHGAETLNNIKLKSVKRKSSSVVCISFATGTKKKWNGRLGRQREERFYHNAAVQLRRVVFTELRRYRPTRCVNW